MKLLDEQLERARLEAVNGRISDMEEWLRIISSSDNAPRDAIGKIEEIRRIGYCKDTSSRLDLADFYVKNGRIDSARGCLVDAEVCSIKYNLSKLTKRIESVKKELNPETYRK